MTVTCTGNPRKQREMPTILSCFDAELFILRNGSY